MKLSFVNLSPYLELSHLTFVKNAVRYKFSNSLRQIDETMTFRDTENVQCVEDQCGAKIIGRIGGSVDGRYRTRLRGLIT